MEGKREIEQKDSIILVHDSGQGLHSEGPYAPHHPRILGKASVKYAEPVCWWKQAQAHQKETEISSNKRVQQEQVNSSDVSLM